MRTTTLLAAIAVLSTAIGAPALAGDHHKRDRQQASVPTEIGYDHGMQAVTHDSAAGQPGHGWQYFSDPTTQRAVVISPQGDYYLSQGRGLRWVASAQGQA